MGSNIKNQDDPHLDRSQQPYLAIPDKCIYLFESLCRIYGAVGGLKAPQEQTTQTRQEMSFQQRAAAKRSFDALSFARHSAGLRSLQGGESLAHSSEGGDRPAQTHIIIRI